MRFYLVQAHPDREPEPYSDAEGFAHFGAAWPEVRGEELAPDGSDRTLAEADEMAPSAERMKTSAETRREGEDRCRVWGCRVPMSPSGAIGTCGNHEKDKPQADASGGR